MISPSLNTLVTIDATSAEQVGPFDFAFKYFDDDEVEVKLRDLSDNSETVFVKDTDYSLSGLGLSSGGRVTLIDTSNPWVDAAGDLQVGYKLFIYFVPKVEQLIRFRDLGRTAPVNIENALDRLTQFFKGFFSGLGDVARSIKLPTNVHPDEFSPILPSDLADSAGLVPAVNSTRDGFVMTDIFSAFAPGAVQTLSAGQEIVVAATRRQHVRIQSSAGQEQLSVTPFGTNDALLVDGMEIIVEGMSAANFNRIIENDSDYGFIGNGGIDIKRVNVFTFVYNATTKRFKLKSNGAW